jgi:hypothetical protein
VTKLHSSEAMLQRGRGPETAERPYAKRDLAAAQAASTGPRSGDRGEFDAPDCTVRSRPCFNGAAVRRPRRERRSRDGAAEASASTGPRSGDRGEIQTSSFANAPTAALQRGRGPETAERPLTEKA